MTWFRLAREDDFKGKRFLRFSLLARKIAVFREADGTYRAMEFACKHQNWDLATGVFDGDTVTCPRHQWRYDLRTGECLNHPSPRLRVFPVRVADGQVYVSLEQYSAEYNGNETDLSG